MFTAVTEQVQHKQEHETLQKQKHETIQMEITAAQSREEGNMEGC